MFKRLSLGLLLSLVPLLAKNPILISKNELPSIEKKYTKSAMLRVNDYNEQYEKWQKLSKYDQLIRINYYVNGMLGQYDAYTYRNEDYWATPKEFLLIGRGDCEDYVSLKFFSYLALGFNEKELFYAVVKDTYSNSTHMVLLYDFKNELLVLDNLSSRVLPLKERTDLQFLYAFNKNGTYTFNKEQTLVKSRKAEAKFTKLLTKNKKGE
jgi:predicted transglutaminase-like cysteine proteinase